MTAIPRAPRQSGFYQIEVVISIGILMSLTVAVASMLRSGFDVKAGLSARAKVIHRLTVVMAKVGEDIEHTFFVSTKDTAKNGISRRTKGQFRIEKSSGDKLFLTTKTHKTIIAGKFESDLTFVVYELKESKTTPGQKALYRDETPYIPEDMKEEPPLRLLADDIKNITFECWDGDKWTKEPWDTGRGDWRNKLPRLVRVTVEAWARDFEEGVAEDQQPTEMMMSVFYLSESWEYAELKEPAKTVKWDAL